MQSSLRRTFDWAKLVTDFSKESVYLEDFYCRSMHISTAAAGSRLLLCHAICLCLLEGIWICPSRTRSNESVPISHRHDWLWIPDYSCISLAIVIWFPLYREYSLGLRRKPWPSRVIVLVFSKETNFEGWYFFRKLHLSGEIVGKNLKPRGRKLALSHRETEEVLLKHLQQPLYSQVPIRSGGSSLKI